MPKLEKNYSSLNEDADKKVFILVRLFHQSQHFMKYYQQMLGDIYYWRPSEKALLIAGVALGINLITCVIEIFLLWLQPSMLSMSIENVRWAFYLTLFNIALLTSSCVLSYSLRKKENLQSFLLIFALTALVISLALFNGSIGFFDSVSWQIFFLFNASLIVFLDRKWVMTSFLSLLIIMIWMTFNAQSLPFPVRAIRLAPHMSFDDIETFNLIAEWVLLMLSGGMGIVILDFFLTSWRNRDTDLRSKSYVDELTQLLNRRAVLEGLSEEYRRALRVGYPLSIGLIDLDFFKNVNDRFGHPFGDKVLIEIAREIGKIGRKNDLVGRYGGEEFLIVFPECDAKMATHILDRLREKIEEMTFETEQGESVKVTISAGVSQLESNDEEYLQLIARADFALYRAKEFGRNQILSAEIEENKQLAFLDKI